MFGYIVVDQEHIDQDELSYYRSLYCGLCHTLEREFNLTSRLTLNNDMTCLIALLNGLYEPQITHEECRCIVHPVNKHVERVSEVSYYAARMTIVLAYYKALDDIHDEHRHYLSYLALKKQFEEVQALYPYKVQRIKEGLDHISELEQNGCTDIDTMCNAFGQIIGEIFAYKDDFWQDDLYKLGDYLGRFIYLLDAYDDIEHDLRKKCYNPLKERSLNDNFDEDIKAILVMYMSEATAVMESLPIINHIELLRNIFYSGVWCRYEAIKEKREKR